MTTWDRTSCCIANSHHASGGRNPRRSMDALAVDVGLSSTSARRRADLLPSDRIAGMGEPGIRVSRCALFAKALPSGFVSTPPLVRRSEWASLVAITGARRGTAERGERGCRRGTVVGLGQGTDLHRLGVGEALLQVLEATGDRPHLIFEVTRCILDEPMRRAISSSVENSPE